MLFKNRKNIRRSKKELLEMKTMTAEITNSVEELKDKVKCSER